MIRYLKYNFISFNGWIYMLYNFIRLQGSESFLDYMETHLSFLNLKYQSKETKKKKKNNNNNNNNNNNPTLSN